MYLCRLSFRGLVISKSEKQNIIQGFKMNKIYFLLILLSMLGKLNAQVNFLDGFNSNMTMKMVKLRLNSGGYTIRDIQQSYIQANKKTLHGNWLFYEFHFCNNKLVSYRSDFEASMKNFIQVFDKLSKRFGHKLSAYSKIDLLSTYCESREFELIWNVGTLLEIELSY